ncbi:hypothetical protein ACIRJM_25035 [Streptomyces sp. NPDC102405]|uniref:hypothetical protein n=1 Tax=Streptomyces sp. NPDC102405 TaxID=3366170 RepID=UPI00381BF423
MAGRTGPRPREPTAQAAGTAFFAVWPAAPVPREPTGHAAVTDYSSARLDAPGRARRSRPSTADRSSPDPSQGTPPCRPSSRRGARALQLA